MLLQSKEKPRLAQNPHRHLGMCRQTYMRMYVLSYMYFYNFCRFFDPTLNQCCSGNPQKIPKNLTLAQDHLASAKLCMHVLVLADIFFVASGYCVHVCVEITKDRYISPRCAKTHSYVF